MQDVFLLIISHPFSDIEIIMSLWGAFGVIMFFWGFIGYFLSHGHTEHQDHARSQMVWGVMLTGAAILAWEGIRFFAGFFTGIPTSPYSVFFGILDLILVVVMIGGMFLGKGGGGGGH